LEAICDQSLWIWYAFFGMFGTKNYINVIDSNPILHDYPQNQVHGLNFQVNSNSYRGYYLLADSIYPLWVIFVQTLHGVEE